ncbi:MAG: SDR family oxidoreductase [Myxococcales bacterium]|nr:SDR family oxidoreductase [Myxococcales bacterium]MCB9708174.1 SDR family oxidoreductase [Myxococcales bacterium]
MSIFLTGGSGYLGSYVIHELLTSSASRLHVMVRAKNRNEALQKLWRGLQLHQDEATFLDNLDRIEVVLGDLSAENLGIAEDQRGTLLDSVESVLHIGASLNRRSEKSCLNVNLRGTLSVLQLAKDLVDRGQLSRFTHVSTVAVAGKRHRETVHEAEAIDWERSDYDAYARTKKFCEHMARQLLPADRVQFLRPSIVLGDSRFPKTTQFDMARAFCALVDLPVVPLHSDARLDIVNADFVGSAIARLHLLQSPHHDIYHLSSGADAPSAGHIAHVMAQALDRRPSWFVPALQGAFEGSIGLGLKLSHDAKGHQLAALLKVFWPYISYDTVFDNTRVKNELGIKPIPFTAYCAGLYDFAKTHRFQYPYRPMPKISLEVT